ncbi:Ig-like domain-containing protein [Clostridium tyrobutyricum]|uniref:Ig-like domain-containing protein n=1 Tax=Clostridium tyrobutyricum TaxID=1519 RepID=UPI001C3859DB|nr:Ig-like domain-containing protein [Clostridium tyrobutyricum]MBV4427594.1 Ig-like domain-containing protein [Clostridium tyrobutyricum]MBV4442669.1 Ig-like domain-containing protein [Clostridium tyrobutyricum]
MNTLLNFYNTALKRMGKTCIVNNDKNNIIQGIFKEIDDRDNSEDQKYFITSATLKQGDIISNNNINYLIITKNENINDVYDLYTIEKCNYNINFIFNNIVFPQYAIITNQTTGVNGEIITVPANQILVVVQDNNFTNQIKVDDVFIKFKHRWQITGVDYTKDGILTVYANQVANHEKDDLINEIPEGAATYNPIVSATPNPLNVNVNNTIQITATVSNNGVNVENPTLIYTSNNKDIATVDNTGLVTGVAEGNANITISYVGIDGNTYNTTVATTVEESAPDVIEIVLTDENEDNFNIYSNIENIVHVKLLVNGVEDNTATFNFSIKNDTEGLPYQTVTLSNITSNSCQLNPNTHHQYGISTLTVTLQRDTTITKNQIVSMEKL